MRLNARPLVRASGEAYLVRYIDDFVACFQFREDALRLQEALRKRLGKFGLTLEPTKTKLVEFDAPHRRRMADLRHLPRRRVPTRRSEFSAILRTDGVDGLIAALNRKADLLTGTTAKAF